MLNGFFGATLSTRPFNKRADLQSLVPYLINICGVKKKNGLLGFLNATATWGSSGGGKYFRTQLLPSRHFESDFMTRLFFILEI